MTRSAFPYDHVTSMTSKVPLCTRRLTSFDRDYYSKDKVANGSGVGSEKFSNQMRGRFSDTAISNLASKFF